MCCNDESPCCCPEKPKPEECSPEQIRECHGEVTEHPCEHTFAPLSTGEVEESTPG
jgi:hypothetical protein